MAINAINQCERNSQHLSARHVNGYYGFYQHPYHPSCFLEKTQCFYLSTLMLKPSILILFNTSFYVKTLLFLLSTRPLFPIPLYMGMSRPPAGAMPSSSCGFPNASASSKRPRPGKRWSAPSPGELWQCGPRGTKLVKFKELELDGIRWN